MSFTAVMSCIKVKPNQRMVIFFKLFFSKLKHEIRKTFDVSLYLLVQMFGFHSIYCCQISVKHNLFSSDYSNHRLNMLVTSGNWSQVATGSLALPSIFSFAIFLYY